MSKTPSDEAQLDAVRAAAYAMDEGRLPSKSQCLYLAVLLRAVEARYVALIEAKRKGAAK